MMPAGKGIAFIIFGRLVFDRWRRGAHGPAALPLSSLADAEV
jgi:hypothetical protein